MNGKQIGKIAIVTLLLIGLMPSVAMAQSGTPTATPTQTPDSEENNVMAISNSVTLVDYEFDGNEVTIVLKADYSQNVVISSAFVSGTGAQQIPRKPVLLDSGNNEITMQVEEFQGYHGVSIGTGNGAISIVEKAGGNSFNTNYSAEQLITVFGIGSIIGIVLVALVAYKRELDYTSEIKQEL